MSTFKLSGRGGIKNGVSTNISLHFEKRPGYEYELGNTAIDVGLYNVVSSRA